MKTGLVEIISILDRSGSMAGLEKDTIGGYNSFIATQAKLPGELKVTTILFDDKYELLYSGVKADEAMLNDSNYTTRGSTALLDAVGKTILDIGARLANTKEEDRAEKIIFVITTDGQENASKEFNHVKIKEMITHQRDVYKWEFVFFGANIETEVVAEELGINLENAHSYVADEEGVKNMMMYASDIVSNMRTQKVKSKKIK
jgi:Mg-chelatase subunit ChlD